MGHPYVIMLKTKRINTIKDINHQVVPLKDNILIFVDNVLYAKVENKEEVQNCLRRVLNSRKCYY